MKFDLNLILNALIALAIFAVVSKLFLDEAIAKMVN